MFLFGSKIPLTGIAHRVVAEKRISSSTRITIPSQHQRQRQRQQRYPQRYPQRRRIFTSPCCCLEGLVTRKYNRQQPLRRFFLSETNTTDNDSKSSKSSISKSSGGEREREQLWEEMSPETRALASSIIGHNPTLGADHGIHQNENNITCHREEATSKKKVPIGNGMHHRVAISRAITLMESKHPSKKKQGDLLLTYLLSLSSSNDETQSQNNETRTTASRHTNNLNHRSTSFPTPTLRVGFAGPPGAGKSSMMEVFGMKLLEQDPDLKLAVLCIDPSSSISGGSILGDKTRMTRLSRQVDRALVRPSCNSGILGGLSAYTDDVVRLLGCAGYPLVLVETVGLGQSEIEVAQSVDVLVLLVPPSGGDDLQGVKKGIVEMANILAVTKNDGDLQAAADRTAADYKGAIRVLHQSNSNNSFGNSSSTNNSCLGSSNNTRWMPPVIKTSSVTELGLDDLWKTILEYQNHLLETGEWHDQRQKQAKYWMWKQFGRMIQIKMREDPRLRERAYQLEQKMLQGLLTPRVAAQILQDELFDSAK
jgi:LAO/AO transport system kinase